MVGPFARSLWLDVEPLFIAFMTAKMFWPQICLKIGRLWLKFRWSKSRSIFWKGNQRMFDQFSLPLFSTRTFLTGELAILKSVIFWIQTCLFGFSSLILQTSFKFINAKRLTNKLSKTASKLIVQKLRNMNLFISHAFFSLLFFQPNN